MMHTAWHSVSHDPRPLALTHSPSLDCEDSTVTSTTPVSSDYPFNCECKKDAIWGKKGTSKSSRHIDTLSYYQSEYMKAG